ncbi:MAG: tyrosine/phenylalanine carboxypeptidase domain-containing protein, partial [Planctomycetota bacterium]
IERVEDPTLAWLFREKRRELDLQINLLLERDSPRALYSSLQLFGPVEDELLATAQRILQEIPARSREDSAGGTLDAEAFAAEARAELAYYRRKQPDLPNEVRVRDDMVGLMVSRGNLLVGREARIPASRVEALLQHEVGTHVLTYYNGAQQPFQQLHCGLAGYEGLQEGLAVLAEYLVGGLSRPRLRLLAARVVAVRSLIEGARFDDTFHLLSGLHGFNRKTAFTVTMRVYRGGGLTKDAIYLRGLVQVCDYLRRGGDLDTLFVGKIAADHVPMILELQRRKILYTPALRPRYLKHPVAARSLERVRNGLAVLDLVKGSAK